MARKRKKEDDRRGESESPINEAHDKTSNGLNDTNGILRNSTEPTAQNTAGSDVSNETVEDNSANPILPPYVYRIGHSDKFGCKYCSIRDDKWGMEKHYHPNEEGKQ